MLENPQLNNENVKMKMGCYGIGVSRIAAAAIEQSNDEKGIIWPESIAPYKLTIISIGYSKNDKINNYSDKLYDKLKNIEVPFGRKIYPLSMNGN